MDKLIAATRNPRDRAFIALLAGSGMRITEAIQIKETDVDFTNRTLSILHLKARAKLKCPNCGELLGKRHFFCPGCGNKVSQAVREKVEQRRQRTIPIDDDTLALIKKYLKWRRQFPYRGPLLFPFTRQRGWQLTERIGRRAEYPDSHPHSFRHFLATTWVAKGLDTKKLQLLLGHAKYPQRWPMLIPILRHCSRNIRNFGKVMMMKDPLNKKPTIQKEPSNDYDRRGPRNKSVPWGRGASEYRPGIFTKQYFENHGEACAADIYRSLTEKIIALNEERVWIGDTSISAAQELLELQSLFPLVSHHGSHRAHGQTGACQLQFLHYKVFYRLTEKGQAETKAWGGPVRATHPEFI